jgi:hypothetical protein
MHDPSIVSGSVPNVRIVRREPETPQRRERRRDIADREQSAADFQVALVANDVRRRLRPVCDDWDDAEFETLVQRIAEIKSRWRDAGRGD